MVFIYSDKKYLPEGYELLVNNGPYFNVESVRLIRNKDCLDCMMALDNARLSGHNKLAIQTPFGIGSITDLSTSCKTAINVIYLISNKIFSLAVDLTSSGPKATQYIFDYIDKTGVDFRVVLRHIEILTFSGKKYRVNDKYLIDSSRELKKIIDGGK